MIQLYTKTGCPYCAKVLKVLAAYQIPFEEKNVSDPAYENELIALGGKRQMPFLVDGEIRMYESDDIISYLEEHHRGGGANKKLKVYFAKESGTCPS